MFKLWWPALRLFLVLSVLTGILYPLLILAFAQIFFSGRANGGLIYREGQAVGSILIAQKFASNQYFWPRPSTNQYDGMNSGGSNLSTTSAKLRDGVQVAEKALGPGAPHDLLFASASGLDPDLSPDAIRFQIPRIATARNLPATRIEELVASSIDGPQWGFLGEARVNVLSLNQKLDALR